MSRVVLRNGGLVADVLFAGITRPAVALGVPYAALLVNALFTLELFLVTRNLLCVLVCLPLHGIAWLLCLAEPRFFELLAVWGVVRARAGRGDRRHWAARSYAPSATGHRHCGPVVVEDAEAVPCP